MVDKTGANGTWSIETLQQSVIDLGGHCVGTKLVQLDGRPIVFAAAGRCVGFATDNTPLLNEIAKLKEQNTVLELEPCSDPFGPPIP